MPVDLIMIFVKFFPTEKTENDKFKAIVQDRTSERYYPSFRAAEMVGISGRALSKITSSFMVITSDGVKNNLGLSLKFEGKSMKVIDYSRKDGRNWEFSEKAIKLIIDYKVCPNNYRFSHPVDVVGRQSFLISSVHLISPAMVSPNRHSSCIF